MAIGDENYGEGSSREHAAMEPRYLGCRTVIAKSFARIHETNLKQQGIIPLTFLDKDDYDKVREDDLITVVDTEIQEGKNVWVLVKHSIGTEEKIETTHTFTKQQLEWFEAGSVLNWIRKKNKENKS